MKNYKLQTSGFTYVEIMVVIGVITVLTLVGLAGYTGFNKRQSLQQTAETVKTKIRDVENKALVGEKTLSGGICTGKSLNYWQISFSTSTYSISGSCGGRLGIYPTPGTDTNFGVESFSLPPDLVFNNVAGTAITFRPLAQGTSFLIPGTPPVRPNEIDIVIRQTTTGTISTIRVTASGEITIL